MDSFSWQGSAASVIAGRRGATDLPQVSLLGLAQEHIAARLLARAFLDDPLVCAICEAPAAERERRILWSFRMAVRGHCLAQQPAWTIADKSAGTVGVVLASQPSATRHGPSDTLFTLRALAHIGPRAVLRGLRAGQVIAAHAPPVPFTYLRTLGVDPEFHNRGFGSQLVAQVLRAASPACPVYLETAKEENLTFYSQHGLTCTGEFRCLGVRVWRLLRPASVSKARSPLP